MHGMPPPPVPTDTLLPGRLLRSHTLRGLGLVLLTSMF